MVIIIGCYLFETLAKIVLKMISRLFLESLGAIILQYCFAKRLISKSFSRVNYLVKWTVSTDILLRGIFLLPLQKVITD